MMVLWTLDPEGSSFGDSDDAHRVNNVTVHLMVPSVVPSLQGGCSFRVNSGCKALPCAAGFLVPFGMKGCAGRLP